MFPVVRRSAGILVTSSMTVEQLKTRYVNIKCEGRRQVRLNFGQICHPVDALMMRNGQEQGHSVPTIYNCPLKISPRNNQLCNASFHSS